MSKSEKIFSYNTLFKIFGFNYFGTKVAEKNLGLVDRGPTVSFTENKKWFHTSCTVCNTRLRIGISKMDPGDVVVCCYCWKCQKEAGRLICEGTSTKMFQQKQKPHLKLVK